MFVHADLLRVKAGGRRGLRVPLLAVGALFLLVSLPFSPVAHQVFFELSGLVAIGCIVAGIRRYSPSYQRIWYGLAATIGVFLVSFGLRLVFPAAMAPVASGSPRLADYVDMLGLLLVVSTMHQQARIRDDRSDPTTVIDSAIVAGGVSTMFWLLQVHPVIVDQHIAIAGRAITIFMAVNLVWLSFCCVRLLMTSRARNAASRKMTIAIAFASLAGLSSVGTKTPINNELMTFAGIALLMLGSAVLEPSMVQLTARGNHDRRWIPTGKMTPRRVTVMTPALLISPAALMFEIGADQASALMASYLVCSWALVTGFVMLRLAGVMRVRDRATKADHVLMRAAASLVAAHETPEIFRIANAATLELTEPKGARALSASIVREKESWVIANIQGDGAEAVTRRVIRDEAMNALLEGDRSAEQELIQILRPDNDVEPVLLVKPLVGQNDTRGALLLLNDRPVSMLTVDALRSLATNVALVIDAADLAERLHQRRSDHRFRSLVERSPDIILVVDANDDIVFMSPAGERLVGNAAHDVAALVDLIDEGDRLVFTDYLERARGQHKNDHVESFEFRLGPEGDVRWFEASITNLQDDPTVNGVVLNARDVTERRKLEQDLRHRVLHDDLTGIANRVLFRDRLEHAMLSRREHGEHVAVLFVDLDDFKTVNDGLGHDTGDELLKIVAFRLETSVRAGDVAARLGGDEFAVLLDGLDTTEAVMVAATRILTSVTQPVEFAGRELAVSASIGVALAETSMTSEELLRNADVAMYHSKQTGKNRVKLFDQAMFLSAFERLEMKVELDHALEREELSLQYQPLVTMDSRQLLGFEALLRWSHPTLSVVPPGSFIPLAEETGAIMDIGAWVLRQACAQIAEWTRLYGAGVFMSVNVSPRQLDDDRIIDDVRRAVEESGIDPSQLTLELTESAGLEDPASGERLVALRALGCQLAADDFGTGFASYMALQQLPFTNVKIDRSLIAGLSIGDERAHVQVQSIIEMGHALGLSVTAEGVEDDRQAQALLAMGADRGQGYLIGRPASAADAEEYLRNQAAYQR